MHHVKTIYAIRNGVAVIERLLIYLLYRTIMLFVFQWWMWFWTIKWINISWKLICKNHASRYFFHMESKYWFQLTENQSITFLISSCHSNDRHKKLLFLIILIPYHTACSRIKTFNVSNHSYHTICNTSVFNRIIPGTIYGFRGCAESIKGKPEILIPKWVRYIR